MSPRIGPARNPSQHASPIASATVAVWVYLLVPRSPADPDLWWHLRDAATQWQTRAWLHRDLYSFTAAGAPWIDHEWLAELPFYLAWHLGGSTGLYLATLLTIEFIFLGVLALSVRAASRNGTPPPLTVPVVTTALACLLATVSFSARTLLFGWACLIVELLVLERFEERENAIFVLPPLFWLWVNLHGSWPIGLLLLLVFTLCGLVPLRRGAFVAIRQSTTQRRKLLLALPLSAGALLLNPYGWHLAVYPFDLWLRQPLNVASVEEWQPLDLHSPRGLIFMLMLAAIFLVQLARPRTWTLWELACAAIGTCAACRHARFLFLAGILVLPLLARGLGELICAPLRQPARDPLRLQAGLLAAMLVFAVSLTLQRTKLSSPPNPFPAGAIPALERLPPNARLFNEYAWGGYLGYRLPGRPVFIDSRMDIFERNGTLRDYLDIIHLKGSLALLDKHRIGYVLFEKDTALVYLLEQTHAWKPDFDDGRTVLLERAARPHQLPPPAMEIRSEMAAR